MAMNKAQNMLEYEEELTSRPRKTWFQSKEEKRKAKIINLNKARKARAKTRKRAEADENAVRHGRTKAQKTLDKANADKANRHLDGHRTEE